jgi:hypothetical protein
MNTVQDKSEQPMEKVQDTIAVKNESTVKSATTGNGNKRPLDRATDLREAAYEEWLENAAEMDRLQTLTHRAHKRNYKLQSLIQRTHKVRYAIMKRDNDSELRRVQREYNAYDTSKNKVRRKGNESETAEKVEDDSDWDTVSESTDSASSSSGEDNLMIDIELGKLQSLTRNADTNSADISESDYDDIGEFSTYM